jgi:DNA invertase Pin-like site-specific DNA recombinase
LSLEASRLARASSDWYRLLEICALTHTLVIDEEGIYDPSQYDDRLLLGFKGTMSEAELHWLRSRLLGGKLEKARQGQLRCRPPIGYLYNPVGQLVFDPDEQIQQAVRLVFELFETGGSGLAVVKHFTQHQLLFPTRLWTGPHKGEVVWGPLSHGRVITMLHNPCYAGAYAYGRTETRQSLSPEGRLRKTTRRRRREAWPIVIPQAHPGYITWDQFLHNQHRLADNQRQPQTSQRGAGREGAALLQGIVLCGRCGRRMTTRYQEDGVRPAYHCDHTARRFGGQRCQSFRGQRIDAAVAQALLEAVQPAQLNEAMAALDQLEAQARQIDQQWQRRLERARYEADLARRRFIQVDPENRLVARTLERDWNDKLSELQSLEREFAARPIPSLLLATPEERSRVLALAQDLPTLWYAPTTTPADRKRLLLCLIKDVTLTGTDTTIQIGIRWQTEVVTELTVPRSTQRTVSRIVARIRELAAVHHTDEQIATALNQAGWTTSRSKLFTPQRVKELRHLYHIPTGCSGRPDAYPTGQRADGRYSTRAAAQCLNRTIATVNAWCHSGRLDALQDKPGAPYWIKLTPEIIAQFGRPTGAT